MFFPLFPLALLSGLITPVHNICRKYCNIAMENPMRFSVDAMQDLSRGAGLTDIWNLYSYDYINYCYLYVNGGWLFRNRVG